MLSSDNPGTRGRSLRAALEVVRADGVHQLTTRAIARRSGLTQPAIYRHFAGKDELVAEVLAEIRELFQERLTGAAAAGDAASRLRAALAVFRDFAVDEPRLYDALFLQSLELQATPAAVPGRSGNILGVLVERVAECGREGSIRREGPVAIALSLAAHAQGLVLLYRQGRFGSKERFGDFYMKSMDDLLRGMRAGPEV